MNSKTSYTFSSSSSNAIREKLSSVTFDSDIVKRLYLAQQKLRPIIDDLLRTATVKSVNRSNYLTVEQYEDAILASQILYEVDKILSEKQNGKCMNKTYNFNDIKLERENVKVNKLGKICVDTSILIQLIELHKSLGDILSNAQEICTDFSNEASSYTETNHSGASENLPLDETFNVTVTHEHSENIKPKIKINVLNKNNHLAEQNATIKGKTKFEKKIIKKILSSDSYPLQENIVVMYSEDGLDETKKLSTLSEERTSNSEANLVDDRQSSRKIKSTGSIKCDNQNAKVTDVAGARNIILNCLYDLKKVRSFLERIDVDVSADVHIQSAIIDKNKANESGSSSRAQEKKSSKGNVNNRVTIFDEPESPNHLPPTNEYNQNKKVEGNEYKGKCSCGSIYVSESPMELLLDANLLSKPYCGGDSCVLSTEMTMRAEWDVAGHQVRASWTEPVLKLFKPCARGRRNAYYMLRGCTPSAFRCEFNLQPLGLFILLDGFESLEI